jgi:hypothetical protein
MRSSSPTDAPGFSHESEGSGVLKEGFRGYVSILAFRVGNLLVRLAARGDWLPAAGLGVLAFASAIPLFALAFAFTRLVREELDEMLQRIVLEGMAFGLVFNLAGVALYMNAAALGLGLTRIDPPDLLILPVLGIAVGTFPAWRRFR